MLCLVPTSGFASLHPRSDSTDKLTHHDNPLIRAERTNRCSWGTHECFNMRRPNRKSGALFVRERMSLIDTNNSSKAAGSVVQHLFDNRQVHTEARHS